MINNRQAGRRRGRGGQRSPNNPGRPEQGNRIDNRARGNAPQLLEKYKTLARDAQMQGDRVNTEYYLQFADHYFRVLNESRARFEDQNQQRRQRDDNDGDDFDNDDVRADDRFDVEDGEQRQPQQQQRPRYEDRDNRGNRDDRGDQRRPRQDAAPAEDRAAPAPALNGNHAAARDDEDGEPAPRRGRPRRQPVAEPAPDAFDATILPPAISASADDAVDAADEAPAPRRRGRPRRSEADPAQA